MAQQGQPYQPVAGAAAVPQPLPAIVAAPPLPRTFREYFATMPDEYDGRYAGLLEAVSPDLAVGPPNAFPYAVHLFPFDSVPSVWVHQDRGTGNLCTFIFPHVFPIHSGLPRTQWDGAVIAFASDILFGQIGSVGIGQRMFGRTEEVRVPTMATMLAQLDAAPDAPLLGPYLEEAADTEVIRTRFSMTVPHAYVPLLLFRNLSPRDAWMQVGEAVRADGREDDCAVFLNFLRAALVIPAPDPAIAPVAIPDEVAVAAEGAEAVLPPRPDEPAAPPRAQPPLAERGPTVATSPTYVQVLLPDAALQTHNWRYITRYLPALNTPDVNTQATAQLLQSTIALNNAIQATAEAQQVRAPAEAEPKSFTAVFPGMALCLRKLCGAGEDDDLLPMFWRTFAATGGKKNQCSPLLESLLSQRAMEPDSTQVQQVLTSRIYEGLQQFRVGTTSLEDLTTGLSPFLVCPAGYHKAATQRANIFTYTSMAGDGCVATLDNVRALITTTINVPDNFYQLVDFIGAYSIMIDVITGPNEVLGRSLRRHHHFWRTNIADVVAALSMEVRATQTEFLVGVLRAIQLTVQRHINDKMNLTIEVVEPPDFQHIETAVYRRTFKNSMPNLPASYYAEIQPADRRQAADAAGIPVASPKAADVGAEKGTSGGSQVYADDNMIIQDWHDRLTASGKTVADLKALGLRLLPTTQDRKHKLCLSFHLRGNCFDNCRSKATHRKASDAEQKAMDAFLTKHL